MDHRGEDALKGLLERKRINDWGLTAKLFIPKKQQKERKSEVTQRTDECLLPSEEKNEEAGEQSERWERKVRWGLDMTAVSRACVYRSAAVYWGARTERTPAELSAHTQQHAHTQGRRHAGALRGADPNMRDPWAEQNGTSVLIGSWGGASLVAVGASVDLFSTLVFIIY